MAERLPSLVGVWEVGELLNVNRQRVHQLAASADFPAPVAELHAGVRIWRKDEVIAWARAKGRIVDDSDGD